MSQYGGEAYGQGQQGDSQYGGQNPIQQDPSQQHQQAAKVCKPETSPYGQQKQPAMNGHTEEPEDDDKAMMKPSSRTTMRGRNR